MKKRILSVVTSVAVLGSMACASAVSSSAFSGEIKFEVSDNLAKANKFFYAHIWDGTPGAANGGKLYDWQTVQEKMTWNKGDAVATYDVPEGNWSLIIISTNTGFQTYDTVFNANCIGDTCYVMDETYENPVDSKKTAKGLGWRSNPDCGPHKVVSSLGNIIGTAFLPGENDQVLYDNFVKKYDTNNVADPENNIFNWNDDGAVETGKDWETIKKEVAEKLGVSVSSSEQPTEPQPDSSKDGSSSENDTKTKATSSTTKATSSSSTGSTTTGGGTTTTGGGTTTTGDATPVTGLLATLLGALGVAFFARKKSVK